MSADQPEPQFDVPWYTTGEVTDEMRSAMQPQMYPAGDPRARVEFVPAPPEWWQTLLFEPWKFWMELFRRG